MITRKSFSPVAEPYVVEQWTQHWRILDGTHYRDAHVVLAGGRRQVISIREDVADSFLAMSA